MQMTYFKQTQASDDILCFSVDHSEAASLFQSDMKCFNAKSLTKHQLKFVSVCTLENVALSHYKDAAANRW